MIKDKKDTWKIMEQFSDIYMIEIPELHTIINKKIIIYNIIKESIP